MYVVKKKVKELETHTMGSKCYCQGAKTKTPSAEAGRDRGDARCYTCPTQARKAKRANAPQAESNKGSQSTSTSAQQQTAAKKKSKKTKSKGKKAAK